MGIPLQEVGLIICTILQAKYLYFGEELAVGSPKKNRSLQHSWFDSSALETGYTKKKSFCASLSPSLKRQVVPMGSCHATHLKGLLRCDCCGVAPLPGQGGNVTVGSNNRMVWGFFLVRKLKKQCIKTDKKLRN